MQMTRFSPFGLIFKFTLLLISSCFVHAEWKRVNIYVGSTTYGNPGPWNSQAGQDQTIVDIFQGKKYGYFVDLAANDAVSMSNTLTLERDYLWNGVCIEANHMYLWGLAHRKCTVVSGVVWNVSDSRVEFTEEKMEGLGGVVASDTDNMNKVGSAGNRVFPTVTLANVLSYVRAPNVIDYLSLDVEGGELAVLGHFPFHLYVFLSMTVERPKSALMQLLEANGYVYVKDHGDFGDRLYIHKTIPNFDAIMAKHHVNV